MNSKDRIKASLNHRMPDTVPIDFGSTAVTGIHCKIVEALREYYGLERRPVRVVEPYQMLGEVDEELQSIIGVDCVPVFGRRNMFNIDETRLHEQLTPWGQTVLVASGIDLTTDANGEVFFYACGDRSCPPCAKMPRGAYFIDAIERTTEAEESVLDPLDNLEEYGAITDEDLQYYTAAVARAASTGKAVVASFGGAALGDIALVPGLGLKNPKGIRGIADWYMSTVVHQDYVHEVFEKQIEIAIANYSRLWDATGSQVDVIYTCGTDFGTQSSQFCSPETFKELWLPHYKRFNDWVHQRTTWKVFKHSCGSMKPILPCLIEAGFDIFNPVQINAYDMDSRELKDIYGERLTFWGGGVDTQQVLPSGTPEQVREHVLKQCETFGVGGGFVFNAVHNIQANVPVKNVVAMIEALRELRR